MKIPPMSGTTPEILQANRQLSTAATTIQTTGSSTIVFSMSACRVTTAGPGMPENSADAMTPVQVSSGNSPNGSQSHSSTVALINDFPSIGSSTLR